MGAPPDLAEQRARVGKQSDRGGFIGRVQRQVLSSDMPINQRGDLTRYPAIPAGDESEELAAPQLGCSAPVNNAPPTAVASCASLITQAAIDILTERFDLADEVLDVYRAIPDPPFLITLGGLTKSPTNGSDGERAGCRRVRRCSGRSHSPERSSNPCLPQPFHATMLEPRASIGSQASQPHLEDGTADRPIRPTAGPSSGRLWVAVSLGCATSRPKD